MKRRNVIRIISLLLAVLLLLNVAPVRPAAAAQPQRDKVEAFIERLYGILLGRTVDAEGLKYWTDVLVSGKDTGANVAAGIVFSEELANRNLSNEEFINCIYLTVFEREPDVSGKKYWLDILAQGETRTGVGRNLLNSSEFGGICAQYGIIQGQVNAPQGGSGNGGEQDSSNVELVQNFVRRLYSILLGREVDDAGLVYWSGILINRQDTGAKVAAGIVFSQELESRNLSNEEYISCLYRTVFDREADVDGKNYWISVLAGGEPRKKVGRNFLNSPEFGDICRQYNIEQGSIPEDNQEPDVPVEQREWINRQEFSTYLLNHFGREPKGFYEEETAVEQVTRGEAVVTVIDMLGLQKQAEHPFTDITSKEVSEAVAFAYSEQMISGITETTFGPEEPIKRDAAEGFVLEAAEYYNKLFVLREDASNTTELRENVFTVKESAEKNQIAAINTIKKTVAFEHADEVVQNLVMDDILYLLPCDAFPEGLLAKVSGITRDGDKVTVACTEPSLAEVFGNIDISAEIPVGNISSEAKDKSSNLPEVKFNNLYHDYYAENYGRTWNLFATGAEESRVTLKTENFDTKKGPYAGLDMALTLKVDFRMITSGIDIEQFLLVTSVTSDIDGIAGYTFSGDTGEQKLELPSCTVPLCGPLALTVEPYLMAKADGKVDIEAEVKLTNCSGFVCSSSNGMITFNHNEASARLDASAEGSMEVGTGVNIGLELLGTEFFNDVDVSLAYVEPEVGIAVTGKTSISQNASADNNSFDYQGNQNTPDEYGRIHSCYFCVEGDCKSFVGLELGVGKQIEEAVKKLFEEAELSYNFPREEEKLFDWHFSTGKDYVAEFEMQKCPHMLYETILTVVAAGEHMPITGAAVRVAGGEAQITNEDGETIWYLAPGRYTVNAVCSTCNPDQEETQITVEDSRQYILVEMKSLPLWVYGSHIFEYEGKIYGARPFESFPGGGGWNTAIYGDRIYFSSRSAGTSEVSTWLYSSKLDGSDRQLLDKSEFIDYDIPTYDCSRFTIYNGVLYYDWGKKYIRLSDGEKGDGKFPFAEKLFSGSSVRYDAYGKVKYECNSNKGIITKTEDGITTTLYKEANLEDLACLTALTENELYFEMYRRIDNKSYISYAYLMKINLQTGEVTEIDSRMSAGGGAYYNY